MTIPPGLTVSRLTRAHANRAQTRLIEGEQKLQITSPLVPWNSCGAYMSAKLGVVTMAYLPICFFNWINVLVSFGYALLGFQIKRLAPEVELPARPKEAIFYAIGGRRVEATGHETAVTG